MGLCCALQMRGDSSEHSGYPNVVGKSEMSINVSHHSVSDQVTFSALDIISSFTQQWATITPF